MRTSISRPVRVVSLAAAALFFAAQSQAECKSNILECLAEQTLKEVLRGNEMLFDINKMLIEMNDRIRFLFPLLNSDLFPLPTGPTTPIGTEYCMLSDGDHDGILDHLQVRVANDGTVRAGASDTLVRFDVVVGGIRQTHDEVVPTPSIAGGQATDVDVPFPATCFMVKENRGNCLFTIEVDQSQAVSERIEYNNTVNGTCLGIK
ncbi:MAG TPA: CARDB domain-containing protein [Vicinamibacteria bacterium]|nr:CARDB domain-containing protein [Vicinamibacteria bacterium]